MDIVMRIAFVYVALTLAFRALGKRELSQLSPFELVTLLMIAEIVAPSLTAGDESLTGALFGGATLLCLALINSVLTYMSRGFRRFVEAPPTVLVRHGQLIESTLHRDRVRPDEIYSEMHKAGIERLSQVKWGLLEPDGQMSFIRTDEKESQEQPEKTVP